MSHGQTASSPAHGMSHGTGAEEPIAEEPIGVAAAAPPARVAAAAPPARAAAAAPPAIDATRLRVAIARLYRRLRRHQLAGLTPTQLSALATVEKARALRLGDLAAAEGIAPSTLTRLVTALEDAGYVRRYAVPGDARASTLQVTPDGRALLDRVRQETTKVLTGMLLDLTAEQQAALAAALPALEHLAGPDPRERRGQQSP
jgi:DNA-binding MarR family transcriptional regulator